MKSRWCALLFGVVASVGLLVGLGGCAGSAERRAAVEGLASPLVENGDVVGLGVGVVFADGRREVLTLGEVERGSGVRPSEGTRFEAGSVTKAVTAVLVAEAAERGEMELGAGVGRYAPGSVGDVVWDETGRAVRVEDLLRHTSGLPRMPGNIAGAMSGVQPYAGYTDAMLWEALGDVELISEPREVYGYSNFGMAVAGELVEEVVGEGYEGLVRERVFGPLGMGSSVMGMVGSGEAGLATPHGMGLEPVAAWEFDAAAPAGAMRSTVGDLLRFAEASMDPGGVGGTLGAAMARVVDVEGVAARGGQEVLLGWHRDPDVEGVGPVVWHNGSTAGSKAYVGFGAGRGVAVVVLANSASDLVERLGVELLRYAVTGEVGDVGSRGGVEVPEEVLEGYAGRYLMRGVGTLEVEVEDGRLWARLNRQPRLPLWAESERRFFYKAVEAELEFRMSEVTGEVMGVTLLQGGREMKGVKR